MTWMAVLGSLFKLAYLLFSEIFRAQEQARKEGREWKADQKVLADLMAQAVDRMKREAIEDSKPAQDVQDQIDQDLKKPRQGG